MGELAEMTWAETLAFYYAMGYKAALCGSGHSTLPFHTELGWPRHGECEDRYRQGYKDAIRTKESRHAD